MPAVSEDQRKAAAIALAARRGKIPVGGLEGISLSMYKSMTIKQLEEFASKKKS